MGSLLPFLGLHPWLLNVTSIPAAIESAHRVVGATAHARDVTIHSGFVDDRSSSDSPGFDQFSLEMSRGLSGTGRKNDSNLRARCEW